MSVFDFSHIPIQECGEQLVKCDPTEFVCAPMYYQWGLTESAIISLRSGVIEKLRRAKLRLPNRWNFKLWDGFRPLKLQQVLWEDAKRQVQQTHPHFQPDEIIQEARKFIAIPDTNPLYPPPHNTGGTIDLTLVDAEGHEVAMGTTFDAFGPACAPQYFHTRSDPDSKIFAANRDILSHALLDVGFRQDSHEWWHYDYGNQLWALSFNQPYAIYGSAEFLGNN